MYPTERRLKVSKISGGGDYYNQVKPGQIIYLLDKWEDDEWFAEVPIRSDNVETMDTVFVKNTEYE